MLCDIKIEQKSAFFTKSSEKNLLVNKRIKKKAIKEIKAEF